jgi:hypothetical protein
MEEVRLGETLRKRSSHLNKLPPEATLDAQIPMRYRMVEGRRGPYNLSALLMKREIAADAAVRTNRTFCLLAL